MKRYVVTIDAYFYAGDDSTAKKFIENDLDLMNDDESLFMEDASLIKLGEQEPGTMKYREIIDKTK